MEWYFGSESEDLVVPEGYEQAQMISSPETWSHWDMTAYPKKNFDSNMNMNMNMTHDGLYNNNNNGGSLLWNDEADFQQFAEEEARINHMDDDDDIFFSSLLEEDPTKDSSKSHDNTILRNNVGIVEGEMVNSQYVGRHGQSDGSSRYQMPQQYASNGSSMEASVLNDLERVTALFTDKTRICFRDAFYRLAENSKESLNSCQAEESMMTSNDDNMRAGETTDVESKTNVIDRAVASLIFHNSEFDDTCSQQQTDYNNEAEVPIRDMQEFTTTDSFLNY